MEEFKKRWRQGFIKAEFDRNDKRYASAKPTLYGLLDGGYRYKIGNKSVMLTGKETEEEISKITEELVK